MSATAQMLHEMLNSASECVFFVSFLVNSEVILTASANMCFLWRALQAFPHGIFQPIFFLVYKDLTKRQLAETNNKLSPHEGLWEVNLICSVSKAC